MKGMKGMKRMKKSRLKFLRVEKGYINPASITHIRDGLDANDAPCLTIRFVAGSSRELRRDDRVCFIAGLERWHCRDVEVSLGSSRLRRMKL